MLFMVYPMTAFLVGSRLWRALPIWWRRAAPRTGPPTLTGAGPVGWSIWRRAARCVCAPGTPSTARAIRWSCSTRAERTRAPSARIWRRSRRPVPRVHAGPARARADARCGRSHLVRADGRGHGGVHRAVVGAPVYLVGCSDGAVVALATALARPDLVRQVVLVAGVFHHDGWVPGAIYLDEESAQFLRSYYGEVSPDGVDHFDVVQAKLDRMHENEPTLTTTDLAALRHRTLVMVATTTRCGWSTPSRCTGPCRQGSWPSSRVRRTASWSRSPTWSTGSSSTSSPSRRPRHSPRSAAGCDGALATTSGKLWRRDGHRAAGPSHASRYSFLGVGGRGPSGAGRGSVVPRSATSAARAVVIGHGGDQADRAHRAAHDLLGEELAGEQVAHVPPAGDQQEQQRQRGAGVGQHDRVDRGRDVRAPDPDRRLVERQPRGGAWATARPR